MPYAIKEARAAGRRGEVPVGAVIISPNGDIVAQAGNEVRARADPSAHAEVLAIRRACAHIGNERLAGFSLYVTLEPCVFCAALIAAARIARLYYGASDAKSGGIEQGACVFEQKECHHKPEIYAGIDAPRCAALLQKFFRERR